MCGNLKGSGNDLPTIHQMQHLIRHFDHIVNIKPEETHNEGANSIIHIHSLTTTPKRKRNTKPQKDTIIKSKGFQWKNSSYYHPNCEK